MSSDLFVPQRDMVLSIKPQYSEKIIVGRKTVELRRRFPVNVPKGTKAYVYSTTPVRAIVGYAEIKGVLKKPVAQIWEDHSHTAFIKKEDFDAYFKGAEHGFVLCFKNARALNNEIKLDELRERYHFQPPQSFLYAKPLLRKALENERTSLSH
jgi:predicted transcriptional regulator